MGEFELGPPLSLYNQFLKTENGKKLLKETRFSEYQGDFKNRAWMDLLGADVNNAQHMKLMYGLTRWFIAVHNNEVPEGERINSQEQVLLQVAAVIHDQAEAVVGDISGLRKTQEDHEREMEVLRSMLHGLYSQNPEKEALCLQAVDQVIADPLTELGMLFHTIEVIGYVRTGVLAWKKYLKEESDKTQDLARLAIVVKHYNVPPLQSDAGKYPAVRLFMEMHQTVIDEIPNM